MMIRRSRQEDAEHVLDGPPAHRAGVRRAGARRAEAYVPARIMLNLQASLRARSFFVSLSRRFEPFLASIISLARLELAYKAKCRDRLLVP